MNYGVVLPIWQLTIADAESLTARAEQLGLDGVFVPDHILAKPATTQHYGGHWPDPFSLLAYPAGRRAPCRRRRCAAAPSWATPGIRWGSASTISRKASRRCATSRPAAAGARRSVWRRVIFSTSPNPRREAAARRLLAPWPRWRPTCAG